ncbi:hypothetical protein [Methanobrevibacter sp. UBA188]|jgi:hypothetical protein|uniref:hypothetical protein n=1 Tax=Methanobrevibacter sp. UBA188 TaxID=1915473 RepID=UPI0025EB3B5B|nr:hypothetical protein [Methanobrevibacter sp. UBA188]
MGKFTNFDFKSLVFGAAIAAGFVILGSMYNEFLYAFASIGFLYVGYNAPNIKTSALLGAFASTPVMYLALDGVFREIPPTEQGRITMIIAILIVGMLVAVIGAWAKRSRVKAKEEYEKKQKIGKNKKKKQKAEEPQKENKGLLGKITKKNEK